MTENTENLVLEHLQAIRRVQSEHSERLERIEIRQTAMESTLGNLYALSASDRDTLQSVIKRVERLERRLELQYDEIADSPAAP